MILRNLLPFVGSPRWMRSAFFSITYGVVLFILAGNAGRFSDRWGLYGILFVQLGGWQAAVYRDAVIRKRSVRALGWLLTLLGANAFFFFLLDQGAFGPEVYPYLLYERVAAIAGLLGLGTFAFGLFGFRGPSLAIAGVVVAVGLTVVVVILRQRTGLFVYSEVAIGLVTNALLLRPSGGTTTTPDPPIVGPLPNIGPTITRVR